jgi:hypothetical protein
MRQPNPNEPQILAARFPGDLANWIKQQAKYEERPVSYIIVRAVRVWRLEQKKRSTPSK